MIINFNNSKAKFDPDFNFKFLKIFALNFHFNQKVIKSILLQKLMGQFILITFKLKIKYFKINYLNYFK
jgi:hypothetical protein